MEKKLNSQPSSEQRSSKPTLAFARVEKGYWRLLNAGCQQISTYSLTVSLIWRLGRSRDSLTLMMAHNETVLLARFPCTTFAWLVLRLSTIQQDLESSSLSKSAELLVSRS